jgi:hypothetical protein
MDYFQSVVTEYLRANRATFVNTECLIQIDKGNVPLKGRHWYCDAVAVNFAKSTVYLCEVTYSTTLSPLCARLAAWDAHWGLLCEAIARDCATPTSWAVQPWLFIPRERQAILDKKLAPLLAVNREGSRMPKPTVTFLENVTPWKYQGWDRKIEALEAATAGAQD